MTRKIFKRRWQDEFREELPFEDLNEGLMDAKAPRRDFLKYLGFSTAAAHWLPVVKFRFAKQFLLLTNRKILFRVKQNIMLLLMCRMAM